MFDYLSIVELQGWWKATLGKRDLEHRFGNDKMFIYLGEIPNMEGHCVVAGYSSGRLYSGYHPENFQLWKEEEYE